MRHYPTDLLLAVEEARDALVRLLDENELTALAPLLVADDLAEALDETLGGLSQFPWQPLVDSNDVYELRPLGTVVLDDRRPGDTLRGLLFALATGNEVVIRTGRRRTFWDGVLGALTAPGLPLPAARTAAADEAVVGTVVAVPELVPALADGTEPSVLDRFDDRIYASAPSGAPAIRIRIDHRSATIPAPLAAIDCRDGWVGRLLTRTYLAGTTLTAARDADPEAPARIDAKLRYLVGRARRTPYYRNLPEVHGVADLTRLPVLTKEVLEAHSLPAAPDLSSGAQPSGEVLRSGASSGEPRYIVYSRTDWENMVREALPLFRELGVANGDGVVNTLLSGGLYGGLITSSSELTRLPVEAYSAAQQITTDLLLKLVRSFSANALLGMPALILPLLREAKQADPGLRIEKVIYGGTPMTESDKTWLREELGTKVISSILAANDGAQLGYQCAEMGGTLHHINQDYNLIEVVDDEGRALPPGETGHLLVTSMQKFEGPLIRYRIGDIGRITRRYCPCGLSGQVLEYLGRSDGQIKIKSWTVHYTELMEALEVFRVSQLQAELLTQDGTETLILRTESPLTLDPTELHDYLTAKFPVLSSLQAYDDGLKVFELRVECHAEGTLPRNAISGKIKPVIDRRLS